MKISDRTENKAEAYYNQDTGEWTFASPPTSCKEEFEMHGGTIFWLIVGWFIMLVAIIGVISYLCVGGY